MSFEHFAHRLWNRWNTAALRSGNVRSPIASNKISGVEHRSLREEHCIVCTNAVSSKHFSLARCEFHGSIRDNGINLVLFLEPDAYQPLAEAVYQEIATRIRAVLPSATIEHVGSSAIPGAISKGDLDVFVGVSRGDFQEAVEAIQQLGFRVKLDTLRTEQLCPFESKNYPLDVGIQLIVLGSRFEFFIWFRDLARRDRALLCRYNQLKRDATPLSDSAYRALKSKFIEEVLATGNFGVTDSGG